MNCMTKFILHGLVDNNNNPLKKLRKLFPPIPYVQSQDSSESVACIDLREYW